MATYKVIQDVEAEDKLVGPLSLRQFIYAGVAATSGYLGFVVATRGVPWILPPFLFITLVCGFFAFPWGRDQPTEVWALAKIRFLIKPRKRIWDQTGAKELVTVTAPKVAEIQRTNGLSQEEVQSRLSALANTIDSRGWAVKDSNVNIAHDPAVLPNVASDRLVQPSLLPQPTSLGSDISAADDMLDETASAVGQKFDGLITAADTNHRQQIMAQMQHTAPLPQLPMQQTQQPPADYWFMNNAAPGPMAPGQAMFSSDPVVSPGMTPQAGYGAVAVQPTAEEEALASQLKQQRANADVGQGFGHIKTIKTPEQLAAEARTAVNAAVANTPPKPQVTPQDQAAIMNLANNDDLDVATIARQAKAQVSSTSDGEVVINLH